MDMAKDFENIKSLRFFIGDVEIKIVFTEL